MNSFSTRSRREFMSDYFSFAPQGSLGAREQWGSSSDGFAVYSRGSYSRLFPTLADLYYSIPAVGFGNSILANPALQPEDDFTFMLGTEGHEGIWSGSIEFYYQLRDNSQVLVLTAPNTEQQLNVGQAHLASLVVSGSAQLMKEVRLTEAANFTTSQVTALQSPYPYMPDLLNVFGVEVTPATRLVVNIDTRVATSQFVDSSGGLAPTAFADAQAAYTLVNGLQIIGRIENFTGANAVLEKLYPPKPRTFIVSAMGSF